MKTETKNKIKKVLKILPFVVGGALLVLGSALQIRSCTPARTMAEGYEDMPSSLDIVNQEIFVSYNENQRENGGSPIKINYTLNLLKNVDHYEYNEISLNLTLYDNSAIIRQLTYSHQFPSGFSIDDNFYLFQRLYTTYTGSQTITFYEIGLYENDVVRNWFNAQEPIYKYDHNFGYDDLAQYYLSYLDGEPWNETFMYMLEGQRLLTMVDSYNNGYYAGVSAGVSLVKDNAGEYGLYYQYEYDANYNAGFQAGLESATGNTIPNMIMAIFRAPTTILEGIFDFDLFGINMMNLVKLILTIGVIVWIVSVFKKG